MQTTENYHAHANLNLEVPVPEMKVNDEGETVQEEFSDEERVSLQIQKQNVKIIDFSPNKQVNLKNQRHESSD